MALNIQDYIPDTVIAWVSWRDGARFRMRYSGADEPEAALLDRAQHSSNMQLNKTSDRIEMMVRYLAEDILVDWDGLTDSTGEYKYSKESSYDLLRKSKEIRDFVQSQCSNLKNFKEHQDLKNSESGGKKG
jgi:hypothetical protein